MRKLRVAGIDIHDVDPEEALARIGELIAAGRPSYVVTPNAQHIALLPRNADFRSAYRAAALVLPDGIGVLLASRLLGQPFRGRCTGSDLFPRVVALAASMGRDVFLLGGTDGTELRAAERIESTFGIRAFHYSPPFGFEHDPAECERIIEMVNRSGAGVLFLGVGAPKSEIWIWHHAHRLQVPVTCAFGMSMAFFAGTRRRAPRLVQRLGLEWLFRLVQEPRRLWRRYTLESVRFFTVLLTEIGRKAWPRGGSAG